MTTRAAYDQLKSRFPESKIEVWDYCQSAYEPIFDGNPQMFSVIIDDVTGRGKSIEECIASAIAQIPTPEQRAENQKADAAKMLADAAELTRKAELILKG